jgi:hypothetical protein
MCKKILTVLMVSVFLIAFSHQAHAFVEGEWDMTVIEKVSAKVKNVATAKYTDDTSDIWSFRPEGKFAINGITVGTWEIVGKKFFVYLDESLLGFILADNLQDEGFPGDTIVTLTSTKASGTMKKDGSIKGTYKVVAVIATSGGTGKLTVNGKFTGIKTADGDNQLDEGTLFTTSEYYPLGQGDIWNYLYDGVDYGTLTVSGTETIEGVVASKVMESDGDYELVTSDSNGITLYKTYDVDDDGWSQMTFSPPGSYAPGEIAVGTTYVGTSTFNYTQSDGSSLTGSVSVAVTLEGTENVTVQAGTFNDCLKLSITRITSAPELSYTSSYEGTMWLAKGIGKVKEAGATTDRQNGGIVDFDPDTGELVSAVVGGVSYP